MANVVKSYLVSMVGFTLFPSFIITVILLVTFPYLVLEPVGWLIGTSLEYDSYRSSYKPGQSATYFEYFMALSDENFARISVIVVALLGSLVYAPIIMFVVLFLGVVLTVYKHHKSGFRVVFGNTCTKLKSMFTDFGFMACFLSFIIIISVFKLVSSDNVRNIISTDIDDVFGITERYQPISMFVDKNNNNIVWNSYIYEDRSNLYVKSGKGFERIFDGYFYISARDQAGNALYETTKKSSATIEINQLGRYLLTYDSLNGKNLSVIDSFRMKDVDINLEGIAKTLNPDFGRLIKMDKHHVPYVYNLSDQLGVEVKFDLAAYLNQEKIGRDYPKVRTRSIKGMDREVKSLFSIQNNKKYSYEKVIDAKVLTTTRDSVYVAAKSELGLKEHDQVIRLSHNLQLQWQSNIGKYPHYIDAFEHLLCDKIKINEGNNYVTLNYMGNFMVCGSEVLDKQTGSLISVFIAGKEINI